MIRLTNIKLPCGHTEEELREKLNRVLKRDPKAPLSFRIIRRSTDARKKPELFFVYVIDVSVKEEEKLLKKLHSPEIAIAPEETYHFPESGSEKLSGRPVIVGMGPAGLFCGYLLAKNGYRPLILERGADVDERTQAVSRFWETGELSEKTNVSFGEGGAGTFSDGKLNTLVKDHFHRNRMVLDTFISFGAPLEIGYLQKPHIGTDVLRTVVKNMRKEIIRLGGEVRFGAQLTELIVREKKLVGIRVNETEELPCECLVLATGHSARDTFAMLDRHITLMPKAFAVGLRIEHPQEMINLSQYGVTHAKGLGPADYKITYQTKTGRGVYSFCMCPGGYVVNASSEQGKTAVNGMSYHARDGKNANSALIVTVTPEDFGGSGHLAGVEFQRRLEEAAFCQCGGKVPVSLYEDFRENRASSRLGDVEPCIKGDWAFGNLRSVLPDFISEALCEAMPAFGGKIKGFDRPDALFSGIESRTSSPVRMLRNEDGEADVAGIYPCGEGAGYAGGITSAAMDGILAAEKIAARFCAISPASGLCELARTDICREASIEPIGEMSAKADRIGRFSFLSDPVRDFYDTDQK